MKTNPEYGLGWLPDHPDFRDHTLEHDSVQAILTKAKSVAVKAPRAGLPASADLRAWCSPIEHQGQLGSCTAHAGVGLVEYYERRAFGHHLDASRLFLYKVTRNLLHWTGDEGAFLRTAMKALVLFGVPPEEYWPYQVSRFDDEPPAFCYAFAQNYQSIQYYRLDPPRTSSSRLLTQIKQTLAAGFPSMFGFTVYTSIAEAETNGGKIPFPRKNDQDDGGHAVMAVGYDDQMKIGKEKGAIMIRNSWGTSWGEKGYGWLPYAYVEVGLADDWWTLIKEKWIETNQFN